MLQKVFCSNIGPSLSSGNHLVYKAEYMGWSCHRQVWAITFDWSTLVTWNKNFWTAFWKPFSGIPLLPPFMSPGREHLAPGNWGARCGHPAHGISPKPGKWVIPAKSFQNAVQEGLFQVASALHSKVMAQTWRRQLRPMYSALQNRWFSELNEGAIFEQNTFCNICLFEPKVLLEDLWPMITIHPCYPTWSNPSSSWKK